MNAKVNSNKARVTSIIGEVPKQVFTLGNCKGVIEPSAPRKFRMWVLIEDLEMITEVWTDSIEDGKAKLIEQINSLRAVVPARRAAFERLETALRLKFAVLRHGYELLNSLQNRWRESSTERLIELAQTIEAIDTPATTEPVIREKRPQINQNLSAGFCPECGRPSFNGKVHLRCEYEAQEKKRGAPTASTGLTADKSKSKQNPPSSKFSDTNEAPYLKASTNSKPDRRRVGNMAV